MKYRCNGKTVRWAAVFEPGVIDLFGSAEDFRAAGRKRDVGRLVNKAIKIIDQSRKPRAEIQRDDLSDQAAAALKRKLKAHAERVGVEYASFDHFVRATEGGADDDGPLLRSAWVYELLNLDATGANEPIFSGCRTFGPNLNKRICSVSFKGLLILYEAPQCQTLAGQLPLSLFSATPRPINDLGVWRRRASSASTAG